MYSQLGVWNGRRGSVGVGICCSTVLRPVALCQDYTANRGIDSLLTPIETINHHPPIKYFQLCQKATYTPICGVVLPQCYWSQHRATANSNRKACCRSSDSTGTSDGRLRFRYRSALTVRVIVERASHPIEPIQCDCCRKVPLSGRLRSETIHAVGMDNTNATT